MLQTSLLLMNSLSKPRLPFSICNVIFVAIGSLLDFYYRNNTKLRSRLLYMYVYFLIGPIYCPFKIKMCV